MTGDERYFTVTVKYRVGPVPDERAAMQARPENGGLMSVREVSEREFDATEDADDG